jgi:predicted DNA-binding protein
MATISLRIPDELAKEIEIVCNESSCPKSHIICQAILQYIEDYQDYRDAQKRLKDKNKSFISLDEMKARLGV